ncbi:hypothetical protein P280DRAFT_473632 [Massarina eburnea CBS 473.64]|uniref:Uncharacterized protein n=1 Tax=Massarina eburnea CBS 473.64 TaxID=1395130 RepID=A0A6A6RJL0_9PLEO|nr:hypothetical protein P280DRAFT_473632 [Massarina eburnea CBS 473.64]
MSIIPAFSSVDPVQSSPAQDVSLPEHGEVDSAISSVRPVKDEADVQQSPAHRPVKIHHPHQMLRSETIDILSPTPIQVAPGVFISSASPITITTSKSAITLLAPTERLGTGFGRGWNKLPVELKLHILRYNVSAQEGYANTSCSFCEMPIFNDKVHVGCPYIRNGKWLNRSCDFDVMKEKKLYRYMRLTPEIAALAKEIFYGTHIFEFMYHLPPMLCLRERNRFVRRLNLVEISMSENSSPSPWEILSNLSKKQYGFTNLSRIHITFAAEFIADTFNNYCISAEETLLPHNPMMNYSIERRMAASIQFPCEGFVGLCAASGPDLMEYLHYLRYADDILDALEELVEQVGEKIKERITFKP